MTTGYESDEERVVVRIRALSDDPPTDTATVPERTDVPLWVGTDRVVASVASPRSDDAWLTQTYTLTNPLPLEIVIAYRGGADVEVLSEIDAVRTLFLENLWLEERS